MNWEPVKYQMEHGGGNVWLQANLRPYPGADPPLWLVSVTMATDTKEHRACWLARTPEEAENTIAAFVEERNT